MKHLLSGWVLASAVTASACGDSSPTDATNANRVAFIIEAVVNAAASSGDDCGASANAAEAVFREHEGHMRELRPWLDQLRSDASRRAMFGERLHARLIVIRPTLVAVKVKCGDDPRFRETDVRLNALLRPGGR